LHKLLLRQIRRHFGSVEELPDSLNTFVGAIDEAYRQSDADRALLEHTMDRASRELIDRHRQLQDALSKSREAERQLAHQALHDSLTDLPNRVLFLDRVEHALTRSPRTSTTVAVLFIDLDDFKGVNDSLGHSVGDELLRATAGRLRPMVRSSDTCARLGGDEFAIVLEDARSAEAARVVAERILAALRAPFAISRHEVFVGASIGIALAGPQDHAAELLRNADLAMYMAKTAGKHRAVVFDPSMHTAAVRRVELQQELRGAFERREFVLQYQPIVELGTGRVAGLEALVRWDHPVRGRIAPLEFISIAEQTGVILDLGRWILNEACRACKSWEQYGPDASTLSVTVNMSGYELREPSYVDAVRRALAVSGLPPHRLILEVTENSLVGNDSATIDRLHALRNLGVKLAIDDFGTGYSSLSYLQQFPIDILKIDKSFVDRLGLQDTESPLACAVVTLGSTLSLRTIAEGVETEGQFDRLRDLGCLYGQGYLFARPLSNAEVSQLLQSRRSFAAAPSPDEFSSVHALPTVTAT
jgi:diguanylate cyclase (GGDEF)-like protein